ncbi:MarR family winged helix-turn-helix transcriptional regulator [Brevundimonas sp.]|uniref:MarR family winged helix-turn-helix transcriptional regulator n=1 Tax=Brevundimonas sp. TaxID=1871086 RepID=UPI003783D848
MTSRATSARSTGRDKPIDMAGLPDSVGFMLRLAQVAAFRGVMAALKPFDLRVSDFSILLIIEANPGLKQQAVGEALSIKRANLVSMIDALEKRGLIIRTVPKTDKRSYALSLTDAGRALMVDAKAAEQASQHELAMLVGENHGRLIKDLKRIVEHST